MSQHYMFFFFFLQYIVCFLKKHHVFISCTSKKLGTSKKTATNMYPLNLVDLIFCRAQDSGQNDQLCTGRWLSELPNSIKLSLFLSLVYLCRTFQESIVIAKILPPAKMSVWTSIRDTINSTSSMKTTCWESY